MNCNGICKECNHDYTRQRLFRGKRLDTGEWFIGLDIWMPWFHGQDFVTLSDHNQIVKVDPKTIGEFTGAFSGNGTMIFEGDIIDIPGWVVTYSTGMKCFSGMQVGWYIQRDNFASWSPLENPDKYVIIGNIHDNPELLKR